jgi:hypothetical protein
MPTAPSVAASRERSKARRSNGRSLDANTSTLTIVARWITLNDRRRAAASRTRTSGT